MLFWGSLDQKSASAQKRHAEEESHRNKSEYATTTITCTVVCASFWQSESCCAKLYASLLSLKGPPPQWHYTVSLWYSDASCM